MMVRFRDWFWQAIGDPTFVSGVFAFSPKLCFMVSSLQALLELVALGDE